MTTPNPIIELLDRLDALEAKRASFGHLKIIDGWQPEALDAAAYSAAGWRNHGPTLSRALRVAVEALEYGVHDYCIGNEECQKLLTNDEVFNISWCTQSLAALSEIAALAKETK
jgi:hypothetical protein